MAPKFRKEDTFKWMFCIALWIVQLAKCGGSSNQSVPVLNTTTVVSNGTTEGGMNRSFLVTSPTESDVSTLSPPIMSGSECKISSPAHTNLTGTSGNFTSPGYPNNYPNNAVYTWRITVPWGYRIRLSINLTLETSTPCVDYIEVRDGLSTEENLLDRFCATRETRSLQSSGYRMWVMFKSDCSVVDEGFKAEYSVFRDCNEFLGSCLNEPKVLASSSSKCPNGWQYFDKCCYVVFRKQIAWTEAQKKCEQLGANLASLTDQTHIQYVHNLIKSRAEVHFWIGLNDRENEGRYQWTDGSPYDYKNWKPGEPSNSDNEDCVEMVSTDPRWNDYNCEEKNYFVCEMSKACRLGAGDMAGISFHTFMILIGPACVALQGYLL